MRKKKKAESKKRPDNYLGVYGIGPPRIDPAAIPCFWARAFGIAHIEPNGAMAFGKPYCHGEFYVDRQSAEEQAIRYAEIYDDEQYLVIDLRGLGPITTPLRR